SPTRRRSAKSARGPRLDSAESPQFGEAMMKSPFPGMDPYLERFWLDVHASLVIYARDALQPQLPPGLRARVEERVAIEPAVERTRPQEFRPDVHVVEHERRGQTSAAAVAVAEEIGESLLISFDETPTEGFIKIVEVKSDHPLVTVVEFLSLSNKLPGQDR